MHEMHMAAARAPATVALETCERFRWVPARTRDGWRLLISHSHALSDTRTLGPHCGAHGLPLRVLLRPPGCALETCEHFRWVPARTARDCWRLLILHSHDLSDTRTLGPHCGAHGLRILLRVLRVILGCPA